MKSLKLVKFASLATILVLMMLPVLGLTQDEPPTPITTVQGVYDLVEKIMKWVFTFLLVIAIIFIFMAAFSYMTAAGDAEKMKAAKDKLIYAMVAIAIALLAKGIQLIVRNLLGAPGPSI